MGRRTLAYAAALLVIVFIAIFVWPTPYVYHFGEGSIIRISRLTQSVSIWDGWNWKSTTEGEPARRVSDTELRRIKVTGTSLSEHLLSYRLFNDTSLRLTEVRFVTLLGSEKARFEESAPYPVSVMPGSWSHGLATLAAAPKDQPNGPWSVDLVEAKGAPCPPVSQ